MNKILHEEWLRGAFGSNLARPLETSTHDLAHPAQLETFCAALKGVFDVEYTNGEDGPFPVRQEIWRLSQVILVSTQLPGCGHGLVLKHPKHALLDHWYALLPLDRCADGPPPIGLPPLTFHCLAKPSRTEVEAGGFILLFVPRAAFAATADLDDLLEKKLRNGASVLLADVLMRLSHVLPRLRPGELPGVEAAIRGLVAASVTTALSQPDSARDSVETTLLERARRLIQQRLADPELSAAVLCRELFVSRSRLYRLFVPMGGVAAYIRRQRLLRARDALVDVTETRSIVRIAEQLGFPDASAFSRTFKQQFGVSPRQMREKRRALNDEPHSGSERAAASAEMASAGLLLRSLKAL